MSVPRRRLAQQQGGLVVPLPGMRTAAYSHSPAQVARTASNVEKIAHVEPDNGNV